MSTYGDKVKKYEARVRKAMELGLEPAENDVKRLGYYVGRAAKKGPEHERTFFEKQKDHVRCQVTRLAGTVRELLIEAARMRLAKRSS